METIFWLSIGALAGAIAAFAFPGAKGPAIVRGVAVGCAAALAGGLAIDALLGTVARVRVSIVSSQAHTTVIFGLAPALGAAIAAIVVLVVIGRTNPRGFLASDRAT